MIDTEEKATKLYNAQMNVVVQSINKLTTLSKTRENIVSGRITTQETALLAPELVLARVFMLSRQLEHIKQDYIEKLRQSRTTDDLVKALAMAKQMTQAFEESSGYIIETVKNNGSKD